ncbi:uncharacterized protein LOC120144898 [Hibiscus syriacus]|uniref:uncharacterized protein LOC120144898 n=1 Tax=Hibiscus syriacus TaxID=106335 RepID=UPI001924A25A|nr:uncharacterized protein LOC120144898 [Hibiscus syriacus]
MTSNVDILRVFGAGTESGLDNERVSCNELQSLLGGRHCLNHAEIVVESESASTSSSLKYKFGRLQDLHDCIEKLLQLLFTQQILSQDQQRECVDELLRVSLRLLDVCAPAKDALLQVKECTIELQSVLCRKRGATKCFANEVRKHLTSKKAAKKEILKALKNLKHKDNKQENT